MTRARHADAAGQRSSRRVVENRQARFEYELLERFEAGIALTGSEIKSVRAGGVELVDAHVLVRGGEAWLVSCRIAPYANAGYAQHDPVRARKLLLHRHEIAKIDRALQAKGLTVVPTRLYFSGPRVKVEVALARGKKLHDKRESIRRRDEARRGEA